MCAADPGSERSSRPLRPPAAQHPRRNAAYDPAHYGSSCSQLLVTNLLSSTSGKRGARRAVAPHRRKSGRANPLLSAIVLQSRNLRIRLHCPNIPIANILQQQRDVFPAYQIAKRSSAHSKHEFSGWYTPVPYNARGNAKLIAAVGHMLENPLEIRPQKSVATTRVVRDCPVADCESSDRLRNHTRSGFHLPFSGEGRNLTAFSGWGRWFGHGLAQFRRLLSDAQRLVTHPGVGALTALAFVLIIGEAERFQCGKQIAGYLGLIPEEDSSGERRRLGHISKFGSGLMRFFLVEAAKVTVRSDPEWRSRFFHLALRRGRKIAKVAMARRLAIRLFW